CVRPAHRAVRVCRAATAYRAASTQRPASGYAAKARLRPDSTACRMGRSRRNRARASMRRARARTQPGATLDLCELAQSFPNYLPHEPRIYDDITTPQIARVLRQTEQPLETVALH